MYSTLRQEGRGKLTVGASVRQTKETVLSWGVYDCWDDLRMYIADTQLCKVDAVPLRTCVNSTSWAETSKSEAG